MAPGARFVAPLRLFTLVPALPLTAFWRFDVIVSELGESGIPSLNESSTAMDRRRRGLSRTRNSCCLAEACPNYITYSWRIRIAFRNPGQNCPDSLTFGMGQLSIHISS